MQSLCHQFAGGITKIDYPHDKTILFLAPSHTPMGKPDNGEDLAGAGSIQFIYQNYIHMNIQLIFFLLFAIASAAIIFYLESSNHEPLELRSTSPLTKGNIQPVLEKFGAKQIHINDNWIQFEYENWYTLQLLPAGLTQKRALMASWCQGRVCDPGPDTESRFYALPVLVLPEH